MGPRESDGCGEFRVNGRDLLGFVGAFILSFGSLLLRRSKERLGKLSVRWSRGPSFVLIYADIMYAKIRFTDELPRGDVVLALASVFFFFHSESHVVGWPLRKVMSPLGGGILSGGSPFVSFCSNAI